MAIYLDNGATTRVSPAVRAAMLPWLGDRVGNPSAIHGPGVAAERALQMARVTIAAALGADPGQVTFTSGGTEACALALLGLARRRRNRPGHLICSAIEHPAVLETCRALQREEGWTLSEVAVDGQGFVAPDDVAAALRPETALVSIGHGNNIIGTVQPLREIVQAVRRRDPHVPIHTDAVQSFLKVPLDLRRIPVNLVSLSGHKLHGPLGIGALVTTPGLFLRPLWWGGHQEEQRRAGTQNVPGAVGLEAAVTEARANLEESTARLARLRDRLSDLLREAVAGLRVNGPVTQRLPHNLHVSLPGVRSEPLLHALEARGVIASVGSACHAADRSLNHVLRAIGYRDEQPWGHLRLTLSRETTAAEVEKAAQAVAASHHQLLR